MSRRKRTSTVTCTHVHFDPIFNVLIFVSLSSFFLFCLLFGRFLVKTDRSTNLCLYTND